MYPIKLLDLNIDIARACFDGVRGMPKERYHLYRRIAALYGGTQPGLLDQLDSAAQIAPRTLTSYKMLATRLTVDVVLPTSLFIDLHKEVRRVLFES
jgi:hypothetical protein